MKAVNSVANDSTIMYFKFYLTLELSITTKYKNQRSWNARNRKKFFFHKLNFKIVQISENVILLICKTILKRFQISHFDYFDISSVNDSLFKVQNWLCD